MNESLSLALGDPESEICTLENQLHVNNNLSLEYRHCSLLVFCLRQGKNIVQKDGVGELGVSDILDSARTPELGTLLRMLPL